MYEVTKPIRLTSAEADLVSVLVSYWEEGIEQAKEITTTDPSVRTADELTDLMSGYEDDLVTCESIRKKVTRWTSTPNVSLRTIVRLPVYIYTARQLIRACFGKRRA